VYPDVRNVIKEKFIAVTRSALHSSGYATEDRYWDQLGKQGAHLGNNIGIMCTANGKWLGDRDIEKALKAFGSLPDSDRKPGAITIEGRGPFDPTRGVEAPPGGLIVRSFIRELQHDAKGELFAPRKRTDLMAGGVKYEILEEPNRDYMWLTRDEWKALIPTDPRQGARHPLPASVRERLVRFHLVDNARGLASCWRPQDIRAADIALTVTEVSAGAIRMRLDGLTVLMDAPDRTYADITGDVRLLGYVDYNRTSDAITRFDLVALGPYRVKRWDGQGVQGGSKEFQTTLGFAFEVARDASAANIIPPRGTRLESGNSSSLDDYFRGATGAIRTAHAQ
jgi:hypothetical protein